MICCFVAVRMLEWIRGPSPFIDLRLTFRGRPRRLMAGGTNPSLCMGAKEFCLPANVVRKAGPRAGHHTRARRSPTPAPNAALLMGLLNFATYPPR